MPDEIKSFLKKIEKEDRKQYFILGKFYLNPEVSLGGSEEETIEQYQNYGDIKKLMLNSYFYEFLEICLKQKNFINKINFNMFRKLSFLIFDTLDFKERYIKDLEDDELRACFNTGFDTDLKYQKKYKTIEFYGLYNRNKEHGWIYDLKISREEIDKLDNGFLFSLKSEISLLGEIYYDKNIQPEEDRKMAILRVKTDSYDDIYNCFLSRPPMSKEIFDTVVCDNEFLGIVEEVLLNKDIPDIILKNIIEIIEIGINFKTLRTDLYQDFTLFYNQLGREKISEFNLKNANKLLILLKQKLSSPRLKLVINNN